MKDPIRFAPPADHPQSVLLGTPPRPENLDDDQWETLRETQTRRDRQLFAAILMSVLVAYEKEFRHGPVMADRDWLHEWSHRFESAVSFDEALALVSEAAPPGPRPKDLWSMVACVSPDLLGDCLADPVGFKNLVADARDELVRTVNDVDAAMRLIRDGSLVPDHVPAEWGTPT